MCLLLHTLGQRRLPIISSVLPKPPTFITECVTNTSQPITVSSYASTSQSHTIKRPGTRKKAPTANSAQEATGPALKLTPAPVNGTADVVAAVVVPLDDGVGDLDGVEYVVGAGLVEEGTVPLKEVAV